MMNISFIIQSILHFNVTKIMCWCALHSQISLLFLCWQVLKEKCWIFRYCSLRKEKDLHFTGDKLIAVYIYNLYLIPSIILTNCTTFFFFTYEKPCVAKNHRAIHTSYDCQEQNSYGLKALTRPSLFNSQAN